MATAEPRVFRAGDEEPQDKPVLIDGRPGAGFTWQTPRYQSGIWTNECDQWVTWSQLSRWYEPLTEVLPATDPPSSVDEGNPDR